MNKKGALNAVGFGALIMLFIGIIVALAMTPEIFNRQSEMTTKAVVVDEALDISPAAISNTTDLNESYEFTVTNAPTGWKTTGCELSSITYGNSSTDWVLNTDYAFTASTGILTLFNTTSTNNTATENDTFIDYTYCHDGYNTNSGSRGVASLIGLFAMIALIGFVAAYIKFEW